MNPSGAVLSFSYWSAAQCRHRKCSHFNFSFTKWWTHLFYLKTAVLSWCLTALAVVFHLFVLSPNFNRFFFSLPPPSWAEIHPTVNSLIERQTNTRIGHVLVQRDKVKYPWHTQSHFFGFLVSIFPFTHPHNDFWVDGLHTSKLSW